MSSTLPHDVSHPYLSHLVFCMTRPSPAVKKAKSTHLNASLVANWTDILSKDEIISRPSLGRPTADRVSPGLAQRGRPSSPIMTSRSPDVPLCQETRSSSRGSVISSGPPGPSDSSDGGSDFYYRDTLLNDEDDENPYPQVSHNIHEETQWEPLKDIRDALRYRERAQDDGASALELELGVRAAAPPAALSVLLPVVRVSHLHHDIYSKNTYY